MMELPVKYADLGFSQRRAVRDEYAKRQDGKCHYCGALLSEPAAEFVRRKRITRKLFPKTFFAYPVHLHHDHKTGMTIGTVHNHCNAVLWQYHNE